MRNSVAGLIAKTIIIVLVSATAVVALAAWLRSPVSQPAEKGGVKVIVMPDKLASAQAGEIPPVSGSIAVISPTSQKSVTFAIEDFSQPKPFVIDNLAKGTYNLNVAVSGAVVKTLSCGPEEGRVKVAGGPIVNCVAYLTFPGTALAAEQQKKCDKDISCTTRILQLNPQYNLTGKKVTCESNKDKCQCFIDGKPASFGSAGQNIPVVCNDEKAVYPVKGEIAVTKKCIGNITPQDPEYFSTIFSLTLSPGKWSRLLIRCGQTRHFGSGKSDFFDENAIYQISEQMPVGWSEEENTCKDLKISEKKPKVSCTITNKKLKPGEKPEPKPEPEPPPQPKPQPTPSMKCGEVVGGVCKVSQKCKTGYDCNQRTCACENESGEPVDINGKPLSVPEN